MSDMCDASNPTRAQAPGKRRLVTVLPHFWLSIHRGYRCRDSGVCCSSGWQIPVERTRASEVARAIETGHVSPLVTSWMTDMPGAPQDVAGAMALRSDGHCVFHREPSRGSTGTGACGIHAWRPASCEHFPYVCAIDPRGVRVTLSHYCPTAAEMLFDTNTAVEIIDGPPVFADRRLPEGMDARDALPPVTADRSRLMSWDEVTAWEREALADVVASAAAPLPPERELYDAARRAIAPSLSWPAAPDRLEEAWQAHVAPAWPELSRVAGHYLAAKLFASWSLYLGAGLPEVLRAVDVARAVLDVEAVRQCLAAGRRLDAPLLKEAIRRSDLLLVHYADPTPGP